MTTLTDKILETLKTNFKNGAKAKDIANLLGIDRSLVNKCLYGELDKNCYQDSNYKWYLNSLIDQSIYQQLIRMNLLIQIFLYRVLLRKKFFVQIATVK